MLQNVDILQGGLWDLAMSGFQHSPWHLNNDEPALFVKANGSAAGHFGDVGFASRAKISFMFSFCAGNSTANMVQTQ